VNVAVLKGGRSLERGVSLRSGARVEDALDRLGHEVVPIDVGADLVKRLRAEKPDVAFVAMHGVGGEDGTAQELLEILGIPFTGPDAAACARSIDQPPTRSPISRAPSDSRWSSSRAAAAPRSASSSPPGRARCPGPWSPPSPTTTA
jgi:D-alanine-D-alanine ligase